MKNRRPVKRKSSKDKYQTKKFRSLEPGKRNTTKKLKSYLNRSQKKKSQQKEQDILEYLDYQEEARAERENAIRDRKRQIKNQLIRKYSNILKIINAKD